MDAPIIITGHLGWGNRKGGYEAYGPGGRWSRRDDGSEVPPPNGQPQFGDLLGDALERAGVHEGASLLVVAIPRGPDHADRLTNARAVLLDAFDADITEV